MPDRSVSDSDSSTLSSGFVPGRPHFRYLYFERQYLQRCLQHALNNMLGKAVFTDRDLDHICYELTPRRWFSTNPHKSFWGTGNYDANVAMFAVRKYFGSQYELQWWDARRAATEIELNKVLGILLNERSSKFGSGRHWTSIRLASAGQLAKSKQQRELLALDLSEMAERPLDTRFLLYMDSMVEHPVLIGDDSGLGPDVLVAISELITARDAEIFLVVPCSTDEHDDDS